MGRHPTDKERKDAHAAESASLSKRISEGDDFPESGRVWSALAKMKSAQPYVTGLTALNIPIPGRMCAGWHSFGLANVHAWFWAGTTLMDTTHLLGMVGVYDATEALRSYAPETPEGTLAASYERATFDLLYTAAIKGKPVPNVQPTDIDDTVDFDQVKNWIRSADLLTEDEKKSMFAWLLDQ